MQLYFQAFSTVHPEGRRAADPDARPVAGLLDRPVQLPADQPRRDHDPLERPVGAAEDRAERLFDRPGRRRDARRGEVPAQASPRSRRMAEIIAEEMLPGPACRSDDELIADFRKRSGTVYHPVSTCRMGPDPARSVVDPRLRVHGVEGLRVIDASIFPLQHQRQHQCRRHHDRREGRGAWCWRISAERGAAHENHRRQDLRCRQPAAGHRRALFHLRQADHRRRRRRLWRGLQRDLRPARHGADDRGLAERYLRRPRPARHRDLLPPRLFLGLHAAPGRFGDGLLLGAGDRLLGHHRQGGRTSRSTSCSAARCTRRCAPTPISTRTAAASTPTRSRTRQERLQRSRPRRRMRQPLRRAGLQRRQARPGRALHRLRRAPAAADRHRPARRAW